MMYAVTALHCLGLGLLNPAVQGLMSRAVAANDQGPLQGAMTSVRSDTAIWQLSVLPKVPKYCRATPTVAA